MPDIWDQFPDYKAPNQGPVAGAGGPQPNTLPSAQSAPIAPAPTGTLNPAAWNTAMVQSAAKDSDNAQVRAEGGKESLQAISELRDLISKAPDEAFGPWRGGSIANTIHSAEDDVPGLSSLPDMYGNTAGELASWHDQLQGAYGRLALPKIKELLGTVPRGDAQGPLLQQALSSVGGTNVADKTTALKILDDESVKSWDAVADGLKRGRVDPNDQEYIPQPKSPQDAQALGRGALYKNPQTGKIMRNPI